MKNRNYPRIGETVFCDRLENGLNVYVVPKAGYNKKFAFFATDYGGADRRFQFHGQWMDTPMGVAHFLEHKMFDTRDGNALTKLSAGGASPNAFTSSDITAYHFESTENFQENLRLLLSFVSVPYFTDESVAKEQGIIGQEIQMTEDNPDFVVYYGLLKALYKAHPLRDSVAGTVESISEITADTLYSCHKIFYNPSNMVLCVAGDVDPKAVAELAKEVLPETPGEVPRRDYGVEESIYPDRKRWEKEMTVGMPVFLAGSKVQLPAHGREMLKWQLVGELTMDLLMGRTSPLYNRLYAEGLINAGFSFEMDRAAGTGYILFGGESRSPDTVKDHVEKAAAEFVARGIEPEAFQRQKKAAIGRHLRELNVFDNVCYNIAKAHFGGYDYFDTMQAIVDIQAEDLTAFADAYLSAEKMAIAIVRPKNV